MNNVSFSGNYISPVHVLKKNCCNMFMPHKVSIVELDTLNKRDIFALKDIGRTWDEPYLDIICDDARMLFETSERSLFHRFFVLTTQRDNFNNLQPDGILAATEITAFPTSKKINIDFLQVDPENNYLARYRNYKNIGSALIAGIKNIFKGKEITVQSVPSALPFYFKNKFHPITKNSNNLHFSDV